MGLHDEINEWMHSANGNKALLFYDGWESSVYYAGEFLYQDPQMPLLYRLGFPKGERPTLVSYLGAEFGDRYEDFRVEYFGIQGAVWDGTIDDKPASATDDPRAPFVYSGIPLNLSGGILQSTMVHVWRGRLFMRDSGMYVEFLWDTHRRIGTRTMYNVACDNDADLKKAEAQATKMASGLGLFSLSKAGVKRHATLTGSEIESLVTEAIESMAQSQKDAEKPRPFNREWFNEAWLQARGVFTVKHGVYYFVPRTKNKGLQKLYFDRCKELRDEA